MNRSRYPLTTFLAILQQAEYDAQLFRQWTDQFHVAPVEQLTALKPERWTLKLRLIQHLSQVFHFFLPRRFAVLLALQLTNTLEKPARQYLLWQAVHKLRRLQEKGLTVIAIAGSYGKTSTKHLLTQTLSGWFSTYASPKSYNTPLGLASAIRNLREHHEVFIAELGEYKRGDIAALVQLLQPDIGILTPIGFAHLERFGSEKELVETFTELWAAPDAPGLLLIDDQNRALLTPPPQTYWYGDQEKSHASIHVAETNLHGSHGTIHFSPNQEFAFTTPLAGEGLARNTLPGLLLTQFFQLPLDTAVQTLHILQPISRRLEVATTPYESVVVDNSYNTNPGAWKNSFQLLKTCPPESTVVLTSGFVELDSQSARAAHEQLPRDLLSLGCTLGILRTRDNQTLLDELSRHLPPEKLLVGYSYDELLTQVAEQKKSWKVIWLEGGARELYQ